MSLPDLPAQRTLFDAAWLAQSLFDPSDRYRLFRAHVLPVLLRVRDRLAALYCKDNGRPAVEPYVLMGVSVLQFLERMPDARAAEAARLNLGWKYALDLPVDWAGFHATVLVYFRKRLVSGGQERALFDEVLNALEQAGLTRKHGAMRLDSSHVLACVARMGRLERTRQTLRLALEAVGAEPGADAPASWKTWYERYVESEPDLRRATAEQMVDKLRQCGEDLRDVLAWAERQDAWKDRPPVKLARRVFDQQFEVVEGVVRSRPEEASGIVQNPHDPDAQWAAKDQAKSKTWVGYKVQVMETAPDVPREKKGLPTEQFITEVTTTEAIGSDIAGQRRALEALHVHRNDKPSVLYVDAGYVTDDTLADAREGGYELVGPARPSPTHKTDLPSDRFDVSIAERKAICPGGHVSRQCSLIHDQHKATRYYRFEWAALCDTCPLQSACTRSRTGRRALVVGVHHDLLQQRRREMRTEDFKKRFKRRAAIEGTISELMRAGMRRARYRGLAKVRLANYLMAAAVNINRWLRKVAIDLLRDGLPGRNPLRALTSIRAWLHPRHVLVHVALAVLR